MEVVPSENLGTRVIDAGEPNRVPLCVSRDGRRVWCRRRDSPYELVTAETHDLQKDLVWSRAYRENGSMFAFGPCKFKIVFNFFVGY